MEAVLPAAVRRIWPRISVLPILAALAIPAHLAQHEMGVRRGG
jgi:hypothetical protein